MEQSPPVTFSLRLPADLAAKLDALAEEQKRSRSNVIRKILTEALEPAAERGRLAGDGIAQVLAFKAKRGDK